jgi:IclR family pca regulon transcriptional regulator
MPTRKKPAAASALPVDSKAAPVESKAAEGHPDYMLSLARGLSVISAFGLGSPRLSIAEVARLTGMSRAAARRCIYTLSILGYVRGVNGGYELAPRILTLGHAYLGSASVAQVAQPVLERVAQRLHESCSLAVLDGDDIVYVARASIQRVLSVGLSVGSRLPAYCTSMGRVLLAFGGDMPRASYLARVKPVKQTTHTITSLKALAAELDRVREQGYALVDQELEIGLRSIAVPVRPAGGGTLASINIGAQAARVTVETMIKDYLPVLREAAEDIGFAVGHQGSSVPPRAPRKG